ncbi:MAG: glycerate kinase [Alphaproteobacteria bacterium]|nr:glycerate kinase [Alphaproteobacteria bacterium]
MTLDPDKFLRGLFSSALAAADPARGVAAHLPPPPRGRTVVVGAGKAAAAMAAAVEEAWMRRDKAGPLDGLVVTRYGHGVATRAIEVVEAGHPLPDAAGAEAALRILARVQGLTADDLVLCLISGGGSALLALPAAGITLTDKQALTRALLASGADIGEINTVRKHLSALKGGRLALAAAPARVVTLVLSDVPGDEPHVVASGPSVGDPSTLAEARAVLARYRLTPPPAIARRLSDPSAETPKPGDPRLARASAVVIATAAAALAAAAATARAAGVTPVVLGDAIQGEAREVAKVMAGIALAARRHAQPAPAPLVLLSGGETTVTVTGNGQGGRNSEFLLALALALDGAEGIHALAADTDGIDGMADNAGAVGRPDTLTRAHAAGLDPRALLAANDAYRLFRELGDLVVTGPTRTNVNDFRAIYVAALAAARR